MIDERFSAYLDGEATPAETEAVWSELNRNPALREAWGRQHWLRSLLRDADTTAAYDAGLAARVGRALDTGAEEGSERVVPMTPRRRWRAAASLAAAASVVGAVLLVTEPLGVDSGEPAAAVVADAEMESTDESVMPEQEEQAIVTVADSGRSPDRWTVSDPDVADQLNGYLLEHNGLARGYGMSGATPSLLRVATYGQGSNR